LDSFLDKLKSHILSLSRDGFDLGAKLLLALVILITGVLIARLVRRWLTKAIPKSRLSIDSLLESFLLRFSYSSIVILAIIFALRLFMNIETFLTGLGVTGIILGFGLRDTLSNFASGVLLLVYRPFRAGETVEVDGSLGVVEELTIVNMRMTTVDGVRVIMPNSKVWGSKITNFSMSDRRRLCFTVKVKPQDGRNALAVLKKAIDSDSRILKEPEPVIGIISIADGAATVTVEAWSSPDQFDAAMKQGYLSLTEALQQAGIEVV